MDTLKLLSRSSRLKFNKAQQPPGQVIPSAGTNVIENTNTSSGSVASSKKRKRDDLGEPSEAINDLGESEIRKLQNKHKIKITDLQILHNPKSSSAPESRKANKEAARLYSQPLQTFSQLQQLGVHRALVANIADQAYQDPTEVQIATIPLLLEHQDEPDLLTVAPTGSGKTLAFMIPLIQKVILAHRKEADSDKHVRALIMAPTKELVGQIVNEGRKLAIGTGVKITEMRKGMLLLDGQDVADEDESDDESDGETKSDRTVVKADILVATPLSLVNAITRKDSTIAALPNIRTLVLDEADYLLDPLFRDQVLSIWSACTSPQLRTSLWSATIGSSIEELAVATITSRYPARSSKSRSLLRAVIGLKDTSLPTIAHKLVYASTEPGKLMGLRQLLHPAPSTAKGSVTSPALRPPFLIFTQTIPRATDLHQELKYDIPAAAGGSSRIAVLHSNLSSTQRAKTMTEFRQGRIWILITTDLLSRGVDFRGINGVVNYDIPTTAASYVHRAGRTGRAGRQGGICVTFYTREDVKYLKPIANLISASEKKSVDSKNASQAVNGENGMPSWLLAALPELSKQDRKELKQRGVGVRRAVKESDDKEDRRKKGKNRIGTSSGYERKSENRRKGMVEGSKRRKRKELEQDSDSDDGGVGFEGFGD